MLACCNLAGTPRCGLAPARHPQKERRTRRCGASARVAAPVPRTATLRPREWLWTSVNDRRLVGTEVGCGYSPFAVGTIAATGPRSTKPIPGHCQSCSRLSNRSTRVDQRHWSYRHDRRCQRNKRDVVLIETSLPEVGIHDKTGSSSEQWITRPGDRRERYRWLTGNG